MPSDVERLLQPVTEPEARATAFGAERISATTVPDAVLSLQRSAGNVAVARLIAERELANATSERLLQTTPAAPSYGGQTGARDPAKIRIDAVADFVIGPFVPPRAVNPHINDPAIVHLTWEFYDPADQMLPGSFSTLPGRPNSTTTPFILSPTEFGTGASFREGRYLLRLVGLDSHHRPVAYADRDFNVMRSDQTTGTAAATGHGQLTFTRYDASDAPGGVGGWHADVELSFLPDASVASTDVVFIQSFQYIDLQGSSYQRFINAEQDARKTPLSWSIDRVAGAPQPFYIAGTNAAGAVADVAGWGRAGAGGRSPTAATLIDAPGSPVRRNVQMKFESCAISRSGPTAGECYGCATWGFQVDGAGHLTMMPRMIRAMPSDEFEEARTMWNAWRASRPAGSRPTEAPATRSP